MGCLQEPPHNLSARSEDGRLAAAILREAQRPAAPAPTPGAALEEILQDPCAAAAFVRLYADEIQQFWEGHCHAAHIV